VDESAIEASAIAICATLKAMRNLKSFACLNLLGNHAIDPAQNPLVAIAESAEGPCSFETV
jgi:hypothetical protein